MKLSLKTIYKVFRSVLFSTVLAVGGLYLLIYLIVSIPAVQNGIRSDAEKQLSHLLGGKLTIGKFDFFPFSEAVLSDVALADPDGKECVRISRVGAGINFWRLVAKQEIEITYAELIDPHVLLWQEKKDGPLNIQFLLDALKPKDKKKGPTKFNLCIRNIVIRRGEFSFDRQWAPASDKEVDFNHLKISEINADIEFPKLKNDDFVVDLRRLAFSGPGTIKVEKIGCRAHITDKSLSVNDLIIQFPNTDIRPSDFTLNFNGYGDILNSLKEGEHSLFILDSKVTPSDLKSLFPPLATFSVPLDFTAELTGNMSHIDVKEISVSEGNSFLVSLSAELFSPLKKDSLAADIRKLTLKADRGFTSRILNAFPEIPEKARSIAAEAGDVALDFSGNISMLHKQLDGDGALTSTIGNVDFSLDADLGGKAPKVAGEVNADDLRLDLITDSDILGPATLTAEGNVTIDGRNSYGEAEIDLPSLVFKGETITNIHARAMKKGNEAEASVVVDDERFSVDLLANAELAGDASSYQLAGNVHNLRPSLFTTDPKFATASLSGVIDADLQGDRIDNLSGSVDLSDFQLLDYHSTDIVLKKLSIKSVIGETMRLLMVDSDWMSGSVAGEFTPSQLPNLFQRMLAAALPSLIKSPKDITLDNCRADYDFTFYKNSPLEEMFNLPVAWLTDLNFYGRFASNPGYFSFNTRLPYIRQGKKKLIRDTSVELQLDEQRSLATLSLGTLYPTNKGDLRLDVDFSSMADNMTLNADFNKGLATSFYGSFQLAASLLRNPLTNELEAKLEFLPSTFYLNKAEWRLGKAQVSYADKKIGINDFNLSHGNQFVTIEGNASAFPEDVINLQLANIDVQYIFDTLNINYVNFGGIATGEVEASELFSGRPVAQTRRLDIKDLKYNGTMLGDGDLSSHWDNDQKCITIDALISENNRLACDMKGGIWVTRDSLSFDFDTDKVRVGFLQPFMSAFAEKFDGRASGRALLYGTFKDIDMKGRLFADSVAMKIGYTNVTYTGSDSVIITPGKINIPRFVLRDREGHTARLSGTLTHRYFHDPSFDFRLTDVDNMLCYDTNDRLNPDWYGTIYSSGTGGVRGRPGFVEVYANMTTKRNSKFYFVLNGRQDAGEYKFLTFTDRRKVALSKLQVDTVPDFIRDFHKKSTQQSGPPTVFALNLRVAVNPDAALTLVMDPAGGDKIQAKGNGSISIGYSSESDDMTMYGRYTLDRGTYNFTLQDLILKDFIIKPGSSISFNGDPLDADLNIVAAYRVNTNLTDLDKSFASDKELNRTNVPVDAILKVSGDLQSPKVDFDIDLPTLTEETSRKVRSIISTEDMMSRQIIYLLALNRFYTPEYMGVSSNGGEWASVASSTLSSQLSSMLGHLTDKVNLAPSLRSDKGDFSDVEVDIALSSRLLNNRLLINGNFGYRDRSTSNTTFVGDFDIEYLLNNNGNLRLKAYNHFNDQNYYLRSALTTQGLGVIYRKEFDNPFTFLRPRRKMKISETLPPDIMPLPADTVSGTDARM